MKKIAHYLAKKSFLIMLANLAGRFLGLLRDISYSFVLGTSASLSQFLIAFTLPNLFRRIFGEGALASTITPTYEKYYKNNKETGRIFLSHILTNLIVFFTIFCLSLSLLSLIAYLLIDNDWQNTLLFIALIIPYAVFVCISGIISNILNLRGHFFFPSFSFAFINIALVFSLWFCYLLGIEQDLIPYILIIHIWVAGILQTLYLFKKLHKIGMRFQWQRNIHKPYILEIRKVFHPAALGHFASQLGVVSDRLLASYVGTYAVASLYYAERVMALSVGLIAVPIGTVILTMKSKFKAKENTDALKKTFFISIQQALSIILPSTIFLTLYAQDIIRILFFRGEFDQHSFNYTLSAYYYYMPATIAFSLVYLLRPIFYINKATKTALKIDWFCLFVNIALGLALIPTLEHNALALSTTIAAFLRVYLMFKYNPYQQLMNYARQYSKGFIRIIIINLIVFPIIYFNFWYNQARSLSQIIILITIYFIIITSLFILTNPHYRKKIKKILSKNAPS